MNYKLVTREEDFANLKETWEKLYVSLKNKTVFQSFDWNYIWWKENYRGHRPFIVIFYAQTPEHLSAIFPLMLTSGGSLRFIADTHSDYSDFLIFTDDTVDIYDIFKTFHEIVHSQKEIRSIELKNLNHSSGRLGIFASRFNHQQLLYQTNASSSKRFEGNDAMTCFSYLKAKKRNQIKRLYKKHSHLTTHYYTADSKPFPEIVIREIVDEMIQNGTRDKAFLNPTLLLIIKSLYEKGRLMIQELRDGDKALVMNLILKEEDSDHYLLWITVYRNIPKINIVSYFLFVKTLCDKHEHTFTLDFGRGLYDYKITNFMPDIHTQCTFFYAKSGIDYVRYLLKQFMVLSIKPFYKKHKKIINRILHR